MSIGSIVFLNSRGDILLSRAFRGGVNIRALADAFRTQIIATKMADRAPCNVLGSVSYLHMRHENLYLLATTRANANAALIFEFLARFVHVLQAYFGTVNEEAIKEHFVLVQELLDECMDYGYPQNTEVALLKMYITSGGVKQNVIASSEKAAEVAVKATGSVSWRREGIIHRKNEVFIDVLESVNLLMNQAGQILSRDVTGKVVMRCFLSGMPVCKFGLNDKLMLEKERAAGGGRAAEIDLEDVSFHQCVRLGGFDSDRTISFTPPDGEFVLMNYRATENVAPPFRVMGCVVNQLGKTRVELEFRVRAEFSPRLFGSDVVISVPVPPNTSSAKFNVGAGRAKYEGSKKVIEWKISRFPGGYEYHFSAEILLIASTSEVARWARPPIGMKFSVPMLAASGLHVRFLKVVETKMSYQTVKWVRYISQAGQYECRI